MKREDVQKILENAELDMDSKIDSILNARGVEINTKNTRIKELEGLLSERDTSIADMTERYKDFDAILTERDALKSEKADRDLKDRFTAALGDKKPKNTFTRDGLESAFKSEIAKEENAEKEDADIFATIIEGHEAEYFDGTAPFKMAGSNPNVKTPTDTEAYLDKMYANNPFYKK